MVPHGERQCHFDARQVGVSLVCRLGFGISRHCAFHGGCGLRKRTDRFIAAGIFLASNWTNPGLRMEFWRRKSSRSCVGDNLPVPNGKGKPKRRAKRWKKPK